MNSWNAPVVVVVTSTVLALGGCTSLPDVGPFVEATTEVRSAVVLAGNTVVDELRRMEDEDSSEQKRWRTLEEQWSTRVQSLDAVVDFSESLQAIVSASQQGAQSVEALADSATQLASAAGLAVPGTVAAATAVDVAKRVYREIAVVRAAKSLEEALDRSRRPVEEIALHVGKDIEDLKDILQAASDKISGDLEIEHQVGIEFRRKLIDRRNALYAIGIDGLTAAQKSELMEVDALIASTDEWHGPMREQLRAATARLLAGEGLIDAAGTAVKQWGLAYNNLVFAVNARRPVSTQSLAAAAADIHDLIQRIREK